MRYPILLVLTLTLATGCASRSQVRNGHDAADGGAAQGLASWLSGMANDATDAVADGAQQAADAAAEASDEAASAAAELSDAGASAVEQTAAGVADTSREVATAVGGEAERAHAEAPRLQLVVETGNCPGGSGC